MAKGKKVPRAVYPFLPVNSQKQFIESLIKKYATTCTKNSRANFESFWYYIRPRNKRCIIQSSNIDYSKDFYQPAIELFKQSGSLDIVKPLYKELFKDNTFEATILIGKVDPKNEFGSSISDFNELYEGLISMYGAPTDIEPSLMGLPGVNNPEVHLEFYFKGRALKFHLFLDDNLNEDALEKFQVYNKYFKSSDYISYNGHAGMGVNINHFQDLMEFKKGKHQVLFFNSCVTYGYLGNKFFKRFKEQTSFSGNISVPHVLLNSTQNYFGTFAESNLSIIKELILAESSYKRILEGIDLFQRVVLMTEGER